jgi:hypothetical protein
MSWQQTTNAANGVMSMAASGDGLFMTQLDPITHTFEALEYQGVGLAWAMVSASTMPYVLAVGDQLQVSNAPTGSGVLQYLGGGQWQPT